jgi:hypothetical protein
MGKSSSATRSFVEVVNNSAPKQVDASVPQGDVFEGLDFKQGQDFALECLKKFGHKVNLDKYYARKPFFLVCSFGRACFRLDVHTVALALQACFGGTAALQCQISPRQKFQVFSLLKLNWFSNLQFGYTGSVFFQDLLSSMGSRWA